MKNIYEMDYIEKVRVAFRLRHTRKEMANLFFLGTGRTVPKQVNLKEFVSLWHCHQQAINNHAIPSKFWRKAVGV